MAENTNMFNETANSIYLEDVEGEEGQALVLEEDVRNRFVGLLESRFNLAESARDLDEQRWITAYHKYRGLYPKHLNRRLQEIFIFKCWIHNQTGIYRTALWYSGR